MAMNSSLVTRCWTRETVPHLHSLSLSEGFSPGTSVARTSKPRTCSHARGHHPWKAHGRRLQTTGGPPPLQHCAEKLSSRGRSICCAALSSQARPPQQDDGAPPQEMMDELAEFLKDDLPHLFDERGIDRSRYDDKVEFLDPITRYDSIEGYLFNIQMLRVLFGPIFELHDVKQTAADTLTTRWTMTMTFKLLPWQPVVTFTGESIMQVNPANGKFRSHTDVWDSVDNNSYFSLEALKDLITQLSKTYKTPDRETPKYQLLKRTAEFEVRRYEPYVVVEGPLDEGEGVSGGKGFGTVAGYIQGKNASEEKIKMTTPVLTRAMPEGNSRVYAQVVLPLQSGRNSWPDPSVKGVQVTPVPGTTVGAFAFGGTPTEERVRTLEASLRSALIRAGLRPRPGFALARYNDPRTFELLKRNDIIIELEDYKFP